MSKVAVLYCIPTWNIWESHLLFLFTWYCQSWFLVYFRHHFGLICFSLIVMGVAVYSWAYLLSVFFGEVSVQIICPLKIFFYCWVLRVFFLTFDGHPFSDMWLANTSSESIATGFNFCEVQFIRFFVCLFLKSDFGVTSKNSLLNPWPQNFFPMF